MDSDGSVRQISSSPWRIYAHVYSRSYILIAISEILVVITVLEYAFTKAPQNMRSIVMSVLLFTGAVGSALNEAFIRASHLCLCQRNDLLMGGLSAISSDPYLVWLYGSMACIAGICGLLFWLAVRNIDAEEGKLDNLSVRI